MRHTFQLRRLSGSRANTVDHVVLPPEREITFGRDPECHVCFDQSDDLVSRRHLKIVATDEQPARYMAVDLGSRNGTYVNGQRVFGAAVLTAGARVRLGAGGPEFEFHATAEPSVMARRTAGPISRLSRYSMAAVVALLLPAAALAGYEGWIPLPAISREWRVKSSDDARSAAVFADLLRASVATVEVEWRVQDRRTGTPLAQAYISNGRMSLDTRLPLVEGAPARLPAFATGTNARIVPILTPAGTPCAGPVLAGRWTAKGIIASRAGKVLFAEPGERPWNASLRRPREESAGALLILESPNVNQVVPLAATQFPKWAPSEARFPDEQMALDATGTFRVRQFPPGDLTIEVSTTIAVSGRRLPAKLGGESSGIGLAIVQDAAVLADIRVPPLDTSAPMPRGRELVWVVGNGSERAEIASRAADGVLPLPSSDCTGGAVVFDNTGRVLAICAPASDSESGMSRAVPIRRALNLIDSAIDAQPRHS